MRIPPRDGHPCRPANSSPCRTCRGLVPQSARALPRTKCKGRLGFLPAALVRARPCPIFGLPVHRSGSPSTTARYFSSCPWGRRRSHPPIVPRCLRMARYGRSRRDSTRTHADWGLAARNKCPYKGGQRPKPRNFWNP